MLCIFLADSFGPSQFFFFFQLEKDVPVNEKYPDFHRMLNMPRYQEDFFLIIVISTKSHHRLERIFSNEIIRLQESLDTLLLLGQKADFDSAEPNWKEVVPIFPE